MEVTEAPQSPIPPGVTHHIEQLIAERDALKAELARMRALNAKHEAAAKVKQRPVTLRDAMRRKA